MKITLKMLENINACKRGQDLFKKLFGEEAEFNLENLSLFEVKCKETYGHYLSAQWCILTDAMFGKDFTSNFCKDCNDCKLYPGLSAQEIYDFLNPYIERS
jgi:hypothetical protein